MADLKVSIDEEKFQFQANLKNIDGSIYVLTGATNVYAQNRSRKTTLEELGNITDAGNGIVQIIFSGDFFKVGNNEIGFRIDWSGVPAYSTTKYIIEGIRT